MSLPSQQELLTAIEKLKSYTNLSDEPDLFVLTAALLINTSVTGQFDAIKTTYPGDIPQLLYLDAGNNYVPVIYKRLFNEITQQYDSLVLTLDGQEYNPVNPTAYILPNSPAAPSGDSYNVISYSYEALVNTSQFSIGDELSKLTPFINNVPLQSSWVNQTTNQVLTTPPTLPTQARPSSDVIQSIVNDIKLSTASLLTNNISLKTNSDTLNTKVEDIVSLANSISNLISQNTTSINDINSNLVIIQSNQDEIINALVALQPQQSTTPSTLDSNVSNIKTNLEDVELALTSILTIADTIQTFTNNISSKSNSIDTTLTSLNSKITTTVNGLKVDGSQVTQPVSVSSLPLPTGAVTENTAGLIKVNTDNVLTNLSNINNSVISLNTQTSSNFTTVNSNLSQFTFLNSRVLVDNSGVVQPISVSSLPLPTNAATSTLQTSTNTLLQSLITVNNQIFNKLDGNTPILVSSNDTSVNVVSSSLPTGAATETTLNLIKLNSDILTNVNYSTATNQQITNSKLDTINTNIDTLNLETTQVSILSTVNDVSNKLDNKALASKQDIGNTHLENILNTVATESSLATIRDAILGNINFSESVWTDDSGTFFIRKVTQQDDTDTQTISYTLFNGTTYVPGNNPRPSTSTATLNITQPLTNTELRSSPVPVSGTFWQAVQPVSISSIALPTGAATESSLNTTNSILNNVLSSVLTTENNTNFLSNINNTNVSINNSQVVTNTHLDNISDYILDVNSNITNLNNKIPIFTSVSNRLIVDGSQVTQPISGTVNTGLSQPLTNTELRASSVNVNLTNSSVPVTGTFWQATQPISVTSLPLPTDAATESTLVSVNNELSTIKTNSNTSNTQLTTLNTKLDTSNTSLDNLNTSLTTLNNKLPTLTTTNNRLVVDGSQVTQPISGTVNTGLSQPLTDAQLRANPIPVTTNSSINLTSILDAKLTICSIYINNGGVGYVANDTVNFVGGTSVTNATASLILTNGVVTGIEITNPGQYISLPTSITITTSTGSGFDGSILSGFSVSTNCDNTVQGFISSGLSDSCNFEVSTDNYNWVSTSVLNVANDTFVNNTNFYPFTFSVNTSGYKYFRVRRTQVTNSNTSTLYLSSTSGLPYIKVNSSSSPNSSGLTDTQLRATPVNVNLTNSSIPITGTVNTGLSQPLTDTQLRASALAITGTVNTGLSQPLTDTQLRASAVNVNLTNLSIPVTGTFWQAVQPISGTVNTGLSQPLTNTELRASAITVNTGLSQPLTDSQLRASAVNINLTNASVPVTGTFWQAVQPVSGTVSTGLLQPLTDTQLRASAINVNLTNTSLPIPTGAATESSLNTLNNKIKTGSNNLLNSVTVNLATDQPPLNNNISSSYYPDSSYIEGYSSLSLDNSNRLETHSSVYSDEGSFRDDFSGSSIYTSLSGTVNFSNNSTTVTGVNTLFLTQVKVGDYIQKSTDTVNSFKIASIESDTSLTLELNYTGTTQSISATKSKWKVNTDNGTSVALNNSLVTLSSGTVNGSKVNIANLGDYPPYSIYINCAVSQRISNQTLILGLVDNPTSIGVQATIQFTGTNNTQLNFVTSSSSSIFDTQTTLVTLPNSLTTATFNTYKIDVTNNRCTLSINNIVCAVNELHIPQPYDLLTHILQINNEGVVTNTTLQADYYYFENVNRIQVDNDFNGEPIRSALVARNSSNLPVELTLDSNNNLPVIDATKTKSTYIISLSKVTAVATTPSDFLNIRGSATKTIKIQSIKYTCFSTTANTLVNSFLIFRNSSNTGGTTVSRTPTPYDTNNPTSTATVVTYTVNPTSLGNSAGTIRSDFSLSIAANSAFNGTGNHVKVHEFTTGGQEIVLRGTNQSLSLNFNSVTVAGLSISLELVYTEE